MSETKKEDDKVPLQDLVAEYSGLFDQVARDLRATIPSSKATSMDDLRFKAPSAPGKKIKTSWIADKERRAKMDSAGDALARNAEDTIARIRDLEIVAEYEAWHRQLETTLPAELQSAQALRKSLKNNDAKLDDSGEPIVALVFDDGTIDFMEWKRVSKTCVVDVDDKTQTTSRIHSVEAGLVSHVHDMTEMSDALDAPFLHAQTWWFVWKRSDGTRFCFDSKMPPVCTQLADRSGQILVVRQLRDQCVGKMPVVELHPLLERSAVAFWPPTWKTRYAALAELVSKRTVWTMQTYDAAKSRGGRSAPLEPPLSLGAGETQNRA